MFRTFLLSRSFWYTTYCLRQMDCSTHTKSELGSWFDFVFPESAIVLGFLYSLNPRLGSILMHMCNWHATAGCVFDILLVINYGEKYKLSETEKNVKILLNSKTVLAFRKLRHCKQLRLQILLGKLLPPEFNDFNLYFSNCLINKI